MSGRVRAALIDAIHQRLSNVKLPDDSMLETALNKALEVHARYEPLRKVADFQGDGATYEWNVPADFGERSAILSVEYPAGKQTPTYLLPSEFTIYRVPEEGTQKRKFRLLKRIPKSDEIVRLTYTTSYTVTDKRSDLPVEREQAVCDLGASVLASMLSAEYAKTQSSTLEADIVNNLAKIDHYVNLSRHYLNLYKEAMGMRPTDIVPGVQEIANLSVKAFRRNWTYLAH